LLAIVRGAIDGVSAHRAIARAAADPRFSRFLSRPLHVVAAGKAASAMASAIAAQTHLRVQDIIAIGTHREPDMPARITWHEASHPFPDARSVAAAERAQEMARRVRSDECLLLLLSGGASALMAQPLDGLSLDEKQSAIRTLMHAGADIHALNTVRKHLSAIKGGRLAAACAGTVLTLAVSDVVGDDLSVIGSGPGVADPTTWRDAADVLRRFGAYTGGVRDVIDRGLRGELPDTPKPPDAVMARHQAAVIASRRHALESAKAAAEELGYTVSVLAEDVTGEARDAARPWFAEALRRAGAHSAPACIISAGETTVRVLGGGRGGRNQEFVLALAPAAAAAGGHLVVASIGTDGIDGPTDAAGALADGTTLTRAEAFGLDVEAFLADNNAYDFFATLGDLIHLGRTDTNVGDMQVLLTAP
jgi:hydroxypyruvate reductase